MTGPTHQLVIQFPQVDGEGDEVLAPVGADRVFALACDHPGQRGGRTSRACTA